jgi:hypothetical protein
VQENTDDSRQQAQHPSSGEEEKFHERRDTANESSAFRAHKKFPERGRVEVRFPWHDSREWRIYGPSDLTRVR